MMLKKNLKSSWRLRWARLRVRADRHAARGSRHRDALDAEMPARRKRRKFRYLRRLLKSPRQYKISSLSSLTTCFLVVTANVPS